jgi:Uma2 family endonuclease
MSSARRLHWTEEDYLLLEAQSPTRHEFVDGEIFAMAGAKPGHNQTTAAVLGALVALVRGGQCRAFTSDQRIFVPTTGLYTYADGGVACGKWQIHSDGMALLNPVLLYEVLSPSTEDYDRGAKLDHYRQIVSLRHVLLIEQPSRCVTHHHRDDDGAWATHVFQSGSVDLSDLGGTVALDEIYLPEA